MSDRRYRRRAPRREKDSFDEVADVARSAYRIASKIKDVINIETKSYLLGQSSAFPNPATQTASFTWSGMTPVTLNDPDIGEEDFQRIGDSIKIHHLRLGIHAERPIAAVSVTMRLVVLWDEGNQINSVSDYLYASLVGGFGGVLSPKDWDKRFLCKTLLDKYIHLEEAEWNGSNYAAGSHDAVYNIPIGKHTQFEAGTNTIVTGALKFFMISSNAGTSALSYVPMITYTDD